MSKNYFSTIPAIGFIIIICMIPAIPAISATEQATSAELDEQAQAQAQAQAPSTPSLDADNEEDINEVELLIKIEAALKSDKKILADAKKSLAGRTKISRKLQGDLKKSTITLTKFKNILADAKKKGDEEHVRKMEQELSELESTHNIIKEQSQLTFEAEKTVKKQIELLEAGIIQQQSVLDKLRGTKKPDKVDTKKSPTVSLTPKTDQTGGQPPFNPINQLVPAIPQAAVPTQSANESTDQPHLQTAEQLEANKVAEQRTQEALRAEQIALDYIKQESASAERIKLNRALLKTDRDSLINYHTMLKGLNSELKDKSTKKNRIQEIRRNIAVAELEIGKLEKSVKNREIIISNAQKHSQQLEVDQEKLTKEAEVKREEAEAAHEQVIWLQSPLHPRNLLSWVYTRGPRVLLVFLIMTLLLLINKLAAAKIALVMARKSSRKSSQSVNRANTLALSFRGATRVVIIFGGVLLALQEAGIDIKTVLGGAAILGVAIAFGAQNLMRDYFNGFMILLEDQYELNDVVTINNITGTVERVSMRTTMLRDLYGRAHFIPNGVITHVTNTTYEWARAVFEIPVAYKENVDRVMAVILELANELRKDEKFSSSILGEPIMLGVNSFDESGVSIKFMLQTESEKMWPIRREMLRRIKNKFDELGIEIPVRQIAITQRPEITT
ncbi:MAG: mechanosensitive ion channel domain-containing protein [Thiohalomonadales bacterium]